MDKKTKITKWVDGELSGDDSRAFEAEMAEDTELRNEADGAKRVGAILKKGLAGDIEPPAAEFFNAQIGKRVREGAPVAEIPAAVGGHEQKVMPMMLAPWLVAAAACLVAVFSLLNRPAAVERAVTGVYVPMENVTADVYVDEDAEATVIMFEGLDEVPADREVKPFSVASYEPDGGGKAVFYAANDPEKALYVMHTLGNGAPVIHELQ